MKMKKILTTIVLTIMALTAHAQSMTLQNDEKEDSTIAVIAYFCKNDTMEYQRIQGKMKIAGNDTTQQYEITEKFIITVTDSTSNGYNMEIIPVSCEVDENTNDYQTRMASLLWKEIKDLHCRFTTDEYGEVQHIENWREIRDVLKKSYVKVFDELYASMPQLDSIMPRKQMESLVLLGCSTEDGIKEQYDELEMLFGFHGKEVTMAPVESDDLSEQGYHTHTRVESFYPAAEDEYDCEGDYVIYSRTDTQLSADDVKHLISPTMDLLFNNELTDSVSKYMNEALTANEEGMTANNLAQYCYFFNGWPKLMQKVVEINMAGLAKTIEYDTIEWTRRRWEMFE
ncbi:MAG: hypothetical protein J5529_09490 [Prevotella sp.]|nr:hypothetical protein [Prevotella sp.]